MDGTTDTTRTYALGELTDEERRYYTYVLKANIGICRTVFMEGCSGANLDIMSRTQIWKYGLDYRCGTGHGVGFVGPIHEGPQSLRMTNHVPFQPGMTITDEPGIYEEGLVGLTALRTSFWWWSTWKRNTESFMPSSPLPICPSIPRRWCWS